MHDHTEGAGRVALVTGASSGIGLATAVALARRSFVVVATMRDTGRSDALRRSAASAGVEIEVRTLDVVDDESVEVCTSELLERHGRIDLVINNAGTGRTGTLEEVAIADLKMVFDVNCLGAARVTKAVLPVMRAAGQGHLIAVSSTAGVLGQPFNEAYCAAKFGLEGLYDALAPVAASFGVSVSLVEAGMVATGFFERTSSGISSPEGPYADLRLRFAEVAKASARTAQPVGEVADFIASVACEPHPKLRYQSSPEVRRLLSRKLSDLVGEAVTRLTRRWIS
jgi:NAD(P)-dependent dehydrogenase (short-subunit alcohol dehydrogenase family)